MSRRTILPLVLAFLMVIALKMAVMAEPPVFEGSGMPIEGTRPASGAISLQSGGAGITALGATGQICFQSYRDGNWEIYAINANGTGLKRLTNNPADDTYCRWSPDMRRIVFVSKRDGDEEIFTMNADGSNQNQLTFNSSIDDYPGWSPNGNKIVFSSSRDSDYEIYVMNADGSNVVQLTSNTTFDSQPVWSPDGQYIIFVSGRDTSDLSNELYRMNANGIAQTRVTTDTFSQGFPAWSPDNLTITFSGDLGTGKRNIYSISISGTNFMTLTTATTYENWSPVYSSDGAFIAFTSNRDGYQQVYLMVSNGGQQTNLSNDASDNRYPHWVRYQSWTVLPLVYKNYYPIFQDLPNGDFEQGHVAWSEYSMDSWDIIVTLFPGGVTAHGGRWAAWMGRANDDLSYVQQQIFIPSDFPYLVYYHWIDSTESTCDHDLARVLINGATVDQYNLCISTSTGGWVTHAVNLSAYISQTVTLRIQVDTNGTVNSNLIVDDVALYASAPITTAAAAVIPDPGAALPR